MRGKLSKMNVCDTAMLVARGCTKICFELCDDPSTPGAPVFPGLLFVFSLRILVRVGCHQRRDPHLGPVWFLPI